MKENNRGFVGIARGDIIEIESESGYRNTGVFMWNGKKVINLYTEVDDYGSVPPEIEIADDNDFTAYSWENLVDHNNFVWYSPEIRDRIKDNLNDRLTAPATNIRGTMWTFHVVDQRGLGLEELKRALDENRVIFNASDYDNNIEMFASNQVHGTVRRRARASTSRRTTGTTSRRARNAPVDPAVAEAELATAREGVTELERQLAAARIGGGKRHRNKK